MKEPDKIYVAVDSEFGFKNTKTAIAFSSEQKFNTVGYIRKDVLLEWAKETYLNENASAVRKVCYKQLIDNLSSM